MVVDGFEPLKETGLLAVFQGFGTASPPCFAPSSFRARRQHAIASLLATPVCVVSQRVVHLS
jgi:hypothetical protein